MQKSLLMHLNFIKFRLKLILKFVQVFLNFSDKIFHNVL